MGGAIAVPPVTKQLAVHQMLLVFRKSVLHGALLDALGDVDPHVVSSELGALAPAAGRQTLATAGIRDEFAFATPSLLRHSPKLLGYYRLLLGISQKQFYAAATGLSAFRRMEDRGVVSEAMDVRLEELCEALNAAMGDLISQISPTITAQDVDQLPLLVLGAQIDGSLRVKIGATATSGVFDSVKAAVAEKVAVTDVSPTEVTFVNASGRSVWIRLAADPDAVIEEEISGQRVFKVAIEIKGGTDRSNAHNRAGEAEKSHQKVSGSASDFWTVISLRGVDLAALRTESPTTKKWFDVSEVVAMSGPDWDSFKSALAIACGI